jgi:putative ABC transport system permease protein
LWPSPLWKLALRNLRRQRRRSWATGTAVAVALAGVLVVIGFMGHLEHWLRVAHIYMRRSGHIALYKRGGLENHLLRPAANTFSRSEQARILALLGQLPWVERVGRHLVGTGLVSNGCRTTPFRAVGSEPALDRWLHEHPEVRAVTPTLARFERGRGLWTYDGEGGIGTTASLARHLGKPATHDEVGPSQPAPLADCASPSSAGLLAKDANVQLIASTHAGSFAAMDGEIVNWFTTGLSELEMDAVATSLTTLQRFYDTEGVTYFSVFMRPAVSDDVATLARQLGEALARAGLAVEAHPWNDGALAPTYAGGMQFLRLLGIITLVMMALLISLTLVNSVTLSLAERSKELGSLRAIGFSVRQIVGIQLRELFFLVLLGEAGGLILTLLVSAVLNACTFEFQVPGLWGTKLLRLAPVPGAAAWSVLLLFVVAILSCLFTLRRQLRRQPIELLQSA